MNTKSQIIVPTTIMTRLSARMSRISFVFGCTAALMPGWRNIHTVEVFNSFSTINRESEQIFPNRF